MDMEKTCANCKHYKKHYAIYKTRLKEVGGRCSHNRIEPHYYNKLFTPRQDCKYWEEGVPLKEERIEKALKEISKIKRTLSDIALILKSE